jgi:ribose transport system substrate-binding protein
MVMPRTLVRVVLALVFMLLTAIPGAVTHAPLAHAKSITLGVILPEMQNPFELPLEAGARAAAKQLGFTLKLVGPNPPTTQGQISLVQDQIQQKVDGILLEPADTTAINTTIAKAAGAGIPVATVILDAPASQRAFFLGPNAKREGQQEALHAMRMLHRQHVTGVVNYVLTSCFPTVSGQLLRRAGWEQAVKHMNPFPKEFTMREVGFYNSTTDPAKNLSTIQTVYTSKGSQIKVAYAMCAPDTEDWGKVVRQHGDHHIIIAGHDWLPGTLTLIQQGWIPWSLGEAPYESTVTALTKLYNHAAHGTALPHGTFYSRSIFATKANLAQIRKSPDAEGA